MTEAGDPVPGRSMWKRLIASVAALILVPAVAALGWAGYIQIDGNVRQVSAGTLYRSAQLSDRQFADVIGRYGVRSVINLRGAHPAAPWYQAEMAATTAAGIEHYDLGLSDSAQPTAEQLARLIELLKTAPQPILVHCKAGADRSGLASALFVLDVLHRPPSEAWGQLSFYYGHFPWLGSRTVAMDETLAKVLANK